MTVAVIVLAVSVLALAWRVWRQPSRDAAAIAVLQAQARVAERDLERLRVLLRAVEMDMPDRDEWERVRLAIGVIR
jgi:hypothetical protein